MAFADSCGGIAPLARTAARTVRSARYRRRSSVWRRRQLDGSVSRAMFLSLSKERARLTSTFSEAPIAKTPTAASIFDAHHPPSRELVDDCVHCGFCLPSCPTYVLWGEEADSPRGRIYLMRAGLEGRASWTESYQRHFDTCLGCMACLTACPSGVKYDRLIEAT